MPQVPPKIWLKKRAIDSRSDYSPKLAQPMVDTTKSLFRLREQEEGTVLANRFGSTNKSGVYTSDLKTDPTEQYIFHHSHIEGHHLHYASINQVNNKFIKIFCNNFKNFV